MKRICCFSVICLLCASAGLRAQEAGAPSAAAIASRQEAQENYNTLKGQVQDLIDARADADKRLQAMAQEISELRAQSAKPTGNFASQEDLKRLADALQEIDKKREADRDLILKKFEELGKTIALAPTTHESRRPTRAATPVADPTPGPPAGDQSGYYYVIKKDDTLSLIAQAYRQQGIKITAEQIEKANPTVNANKLHVKQKIFIPAPKSATAK